MKKNMFKSGAAAVLLAGLLAATPGVALAATLSADNTKVGSEGSEVTAQIEKNWTVASVEQLSSQEKFTFKLHYTGSTSVGTYTPALTGITTDVSTDKTVDILVSSMTDSDSNLTYTGSAELYSIFNGIEFTAPGVYSFTLTENATNNPNIVDSNDSYTVVVNVASAVDEDGVPTGVAEINKVQIKKASDGSKVSEAEFNNGKKDAESLKIEKKVAGTAANTSDRFSFTVKIYGISGKYAVTKSSDSITGDSVINGNGTYTFGLAHGDSVSIANLPVGATYEVVESDNYGYDSTSANVIGTGAFTEAKKTVTGSISSEDSVTANEVDYTNNKGFMPQTGITMNTLPFIGVGAVAAAGAVTLVISRKRRAGEDF